MEAICFIIGFGGYMRRLFFVLVCLLVFSGFLFSDEWYREASFYQIFPRSFYDSDGDGIGDLKGIMMKLDYISSLGVKGIWLNPTFPSPSYHGYDITDYYGVNPQFGTLDDMKMLIKEADKRGIKILLDLVINHTSSQIEWFKKSELRDTFFDSWYVWTNVLPKVEGKYGWAKPWSRGNSPWEVWSYSSMRKEYYYSAFWSGMPDLNLTNPEVTKEIYNIARYWLEMGVGGFRMDAVRYLIETGPGEGQADTEETKMWLRNFKDFCKKVKKDSFLIGEVWVANSTILTYGDSLDGYFDFEQRDVFVSTVGFGPSVGRFYSYIKNMKDITKSIDTWKKLYPFTSNHDVTRVHSLLERRPDSMERMKLFVTLMFTFPGNPFIYQGDEIGMLNSPYLRGDMAYRDPMVWSDAKNVSFTTGAPWTYVNPHPVINVMEQERDKNSLLNHYRRMSKIRNSEEVLRRGDIIIISNSVTNRVVSFARTNANDFIAVIVYPYPSPTNFTLYFDDEVYKNLKGNRFVDLLTSNTISITSNSIDFYFDSYTNLVLKLIKN
jgi:glycosidase